MPCQRAITPLRERPPPPFSFLIADDRQFCLTCGCHNDHQTHLYLECYKLLLRLRSLTWSQSSCISEVEHVAWAISGTAGQGCGLCAEHLLEDHTAFDVLLICSGIGAPPSALSWWGAGLYFVSDTRYSLALFTHSLVLCRNSEHNCFTLYIMVVLK